VHRRGLTEEQLKGLQEKLQSVLADTIQGVKAGAGQAFLKEVPVVKVEVAKTKEQEKQITF